jgi:hypothetical protein
VEVDVKLIRLTGVLGLVLILALSGPAAAIAQTQAATMSASDVQRLEDAIADAQRDVAQAPTRDLASQLEASLNDARDDTTFLKVKIRRGETVPRSEYFDLRDRIDDIRAKAHGTSTTPAAGSSTSTRRHGDVPVGTEFDVRIINSLSSGTAQVEDRFEATTMVDLTEGERVLVPAGSTMRGVVSSVNKAGRINRKGSLTLAFDQITVNGKDAPLKATVTQALESEGVRGEVGKIGAGAGVGAIIGGILGGFKGAMAGILIGGGGTIAATEGKDVELPAGTVLRVRLDSALDLK